MDTPANSTPPNNDLLLRQMTRLVEVSVTLNSTLDPEQLLQFIIQAAADLLECDAASILLYDETRGQLYFATATGSDPRQLAQIPVPLEGSIAGTIFRENRALVINNVTQDPRHYNQVGEQVAFQTRSLLGVPMRIRAKTTGVLEALNKRRGEFDGTDIQILSIIASQAAVAIQNARLLTALQKAYDELRRQDKLKSDFIAIASHELRTPLGVILGYATFLKEDAQGELSEHAEMVLSSAIKMRSLVEDMTNLNLLQMGEAKLNLRPLPIQQVLRVAFDEISVTAQSKGHKLRSRIPEKSVIVNADPEKLSLLFTNLLNNALRFTPDGGEISVWVHSDSREVHIEINDNGLGIPAAELENIFKQFYQIEDHLRRRQGGMGIGLAIARGIVKMHNGRIWAESAGEGKGSTFKVVLPIYPLPQR